MSTDTVAATNRRVFVRVKRRRDDAEPPVDALLVKRPKTDDKRDDESKDTVFTFVGTSKFVKEGAAEEVSNAINSIVDKHILDKLEQEEEKPKPSHKKQSVKKDHKPRRDSVSRQQRQKESANRAAEKRFTLIQSKRNVPLSSNEAGDTCDVITLESSKAVSETVTCNGVPAQEEYVYDIYCLQDRQGSAEVFTDQDWKDVKAYFDDIDDQDTSGDEGRSDSEDSNAEQHWRNDYPDEDSEDDDVYGIGADGYNNEVVSGASSDEEPGLCYTRSGEEEALADRHGAAYARFKSKIMKDFANMGLSNKDENESDDSDDLLDEDDRVALEDGLDY